MLETKRGFKRVSTKMVNMIYVLLSLALAIPSMVYLIQNKTVYYFIHVFTYTFTKAQSMNEQYQNAILYLCLFWLLFACYFYLLKNSKYVFQTKKRLFGFIIIVGILFSIMIPTTSLDVYSYIGNGWVDSHYHENPYYTSVQEVTNQNGVDPMLGKVARCWRDEPVIYGPVWSLICRGLTSISGGNIDIALYTFKIASLLIFLACSFLIYKITKKKFFCLLFALNPFILFEFLCNVHNDIFLVFFVLLAFYFIKEKKNTGLAVASIAIATGIKYLSILLLPFVLVYMLKEENRKNKIKKCILYGIEFFVILVACYLFYIRDFRSIIRYLSATK